MGKIKLSPAQIKVLRALAEPGARACYMPYMGWFRPKPYWFLSGSHDHVRQATIGKLVKHGLIETKRDSFRDTEATITEAGREYLAGLGEEDVI